MNSVPAAFRKNLSAVRDAIRYADPRSIPAVEPLNQEIASGLETLKSTVENKQYDAVAASCEALTRKIQERAQKLKSLK